MHAMPQPDADFWNRIAPAYAKKPVENEAAYQQTLARVRAYLTGQERVLEVGCGTGSTALTLSPFARSIAATDVSAAMIDIAREKARDQGITNVDFEERTLDDAELEPESFDVVMAFNLVHLLPDVPTKVARICQLLRPGGLFISKTPCIGEYPLGMRVLLPVLRLLGRAPHVNLLKKDALAAQVKEAGFEILETGLYPENKHCLFIVGRRV